MFCWSTRNWSSKLDVRFVILSFIPVHNSKYKFHLTIARNTEAENCAGWRIPHWASVEESLCATNTSNTVQTMQCMEDKNLEKNPDVAEVLAIADRLFTIIFTSETVLKWFGFGFRRYFTDAWCWLDFVIVVIALVSLVSDNSSNKNVGALRALRTFRALRPLRAVSRWEAMKVSSVLNCINETAFKPLTSYTVVQVLVNCKSKLISKLQIITHCKL